MTTSRKPRRRSGVRIPTLREAYEQHSLLPFQMGHGPLPIIAFKDGPSKRYLIWLNQSYAGNPEKRAIIMGVGSLYRCMLQPQVADPQHFQQPSHDWVPTAPGFPCRP